MLESVNPVSDDPGGTEDSDRIDALLSTALADQARERRMLVETVFGAKSALVKAEEEISGLRDLINKRDDAILDAVAKNNEALLQSVSDRLEAVIKAQSRPRVQPARDAGLTLRIEAIEDAILQLAQRIAEVSRLPGQVRSELDELGAQLRRDLEVSAVAIGDRIGEESASLLADLREDQVEVVQTLADMSQTTVRDLKEALSRSEQELMERVSATGRDTIEQVSATGRDTIEQVSATGRATIEADRSTVEQMVEHLTGYLHERDEQLYRARDQRLIELFQQLSDTIGRTTKRKLGKMLAESEDTTPPQPLAPPMPPAKAPPPLSVPRTFRQPAGEETEAVRSPFPPVPGFGGPIRASEPPPPLKRPDPTFAFEQSVAQPFEDRPEPPFGRRDQPFREPEPPSGRAEESPNQPMANPLTRAELVRDYLIESPSEMFSEDPLRPPAPRVRRKPQAGADHERPGKPGTGQISGSSAKPPANPRSRRKV